MSLRGLLLPAFAAVGVGEMVLSFGGPVGIDALGNRIAVNPQRFGGVGDALLISRESLLNVEFFEFLECLIQKDVAVEHVFNDSF